MSGNLRDEDFTKNSNFEKNFKQVRKVNDPRFGEAFLYQEPATRQQILVRERKYNDKTEAGKAIVAARARLQSQNPFQLRMLDYSASKQSELCSTIYIVRQYWEAPANDLKRELQNRASTNQPFTEPELSNILYQVAKADSQGLHGDISPLTIAYDRGAGAAKLIDRSDELPAPQRTVNLQKAKVIGASQNLYQSPVMFNNLKRNNLKFGFDPAKEDAFALGLTMLELGNLKPVNGIYNAGTKEVDRNALGALLGEFKGRYPNHNGFLVSTVEGLTRYDEASRLGVRELSASLPAEAEFRSRIGTGAGIAVRGQAQAQNLVSVGAPTTSVTQTFDVKSHTIPSVAGPAPSIYTVGAENNEFYSRPNLPPIPRPEPVSSVAPRYTPLPDATPPTTSSVIVGAAPEQTSTTTTTREVTVNAYPEPQVSTHIQGPAHVASGSYASHSAPLSSITYNATYVNGELRRDYGPGYSGPVEVKSADHSFGSYHTGSTGYVSSPLSITPPGETYVTSVPYASYETVGHALSPALPRRSHVTLAPEIRRSYVSGPPMAATSIGIPSIIPTAYPTLSAMPSATETIVYASNPTTVYASSPVTTVIDGGYASPITYASAPITTVIDGGYASPISYAPQTIVNRAVTIPTETVTSAYVPSTFGAVSSYIPTETIISAPRRSYVSSTPTIVSSAPTTYISSTPTYVSSTPTYVSSAPTTYVTETLTQAPVTTYVTETLTQAPMTTYVTGPRLSASPIPTAPRGSYSRTIIEGTTTTVLGADATSVGGMRLVSSYQDPKYATAGGLTL